MRPKIVCLCGSTRFFQAFHDANLRETLAGHIVLSIGVDFKSDTDLLLAGELTQADKERLDELHLRKIDLADEILILNVDGYIGSSTRKEIEYAKRANKQIRHLERSCDYPGCEEPATIECCMIGCMHHVCETHGNCLYEVTPDEAVPICWYCCGKGWNKEQAS